MIHLLNGLGFIALGIGVFCASQIGAMLAMYNGVIAHYNRSSYLHLWRGTLALGLTASILFFIASLITGDEVRILLTPLFAFEFLGAAIIVFIFVPKKKRKRRKRKLI